MPRSSPSERQTIVTLAAKRLKKTAAWPAELAPPTTKTS
jgi:hypothetical protein